MNFFKWIGSMFRAQSAEDIKALAQNVAVQAAARRSAEHNARVSYRRNTRGLPVGVGPHQLRAAKRIKNALACNPDGMNIGESRLHAAETVLDIIQKNAKLRARFPRPRKIARRIAALG